MTKSTHALPPDWDAFIAACPGGRDAWIARKLRRALSTYRPPRSLRRKVERSRLRICLAGEGDAVSALASARFLLVVCTPRTPASSEVCEQIAAFRARQGIQQIIPVLAAGDPGLSFPAELQSHLAGTQADLLAANLLPRGIRRAGRFRAEVLRILASLLGCEYDDLRQRERARRTRRLALAAATLALPLALALAIRATVAHFSSEADRLVLRRGLPSLHPLLGSDEIVVDSGLTFQELMAEAGEAAAQGRWCVPGPLLETQSCFAELDRWAMVPLAAEATRGLPTDRLEALGPWRESAVVPLLSVLETCSAPGNQVLAATSRLLSLQVDRQRLLASLRRGLDCATPGHQAESAALMIALGASEPRAIAQVSAEVASPNPEVALAAIELLSSQGQTDTALLARYHQVLREVPPGSLAFGTAAAGLLRRDPHDSEVLQKLWSIVSPEREDPGVPPYLRAGVASLVTALPPDPAALDRLFAPLDDPAASPAMLESSLQILRDLKVRDEPVRIRLRRHLDDPRLEVVLAMAEELIEASPREHEAVARLQSILDAPGTTAATLPYGDRPLFRAVAALRGVPGSRAQVDNALRRALQDADPEVVVRAAELLAENHQVEAEGLLAAFRRLSSLPNPLFLRVCNLVATLPGDRSDFARELALRFQKSLQPVQIIGLPPPPGGPSSCDLAQTLTRLGDPTGEAERYAREQLSQGNTGCYAGAVLLRNPAEPPRAALARLLEELGSREAERSFFYRKAVTGALTALATRPAPGAPPRLDPATLRAALTPWIESPRPDHRLAAGAVLEEINPPEAVLPFLPIDLPPSR